MAGLQIVIPGADFSGSGIPRNTRYLRGTEIPAYDALGVWLLEEGTAGSAYSGEFANLVPGGPPARLRPGWTAPRMRNFGSAKGGFEVTSVNGTLIDTGISARRSQFTMAGVVRIHPKSNEGLAAYNLIHMMTSDSLNNLPPTNAGTFNILSGGLWGLGAILNSGFQGQVTKYGNVIANTAGGSFVALNTALGIQNQWVAVGISIDGPAGSVRVQTLTGANVISDADRGNTALYDRFVGELESRDGNYLFGVAPNAAPRDSEGPIGDIMCSSVFGSAKGETEMTAILRGLAKVAADRGVTVNGY